jgi:alanine racemase
LDAVLDAISAAGIVLDGVMTHFCAAEVVGSELTRMQERRFETAVGQVRARGLRLGWVHAGSSSSVDNPARDGDWLLDLAKSVGARAMVRCGISLYGYCLPVEECGELPPRVRAALKPVMQWKTRVLDVRDVAEGESIGYNAMFRATQPMRVALLPVGYSDGLRRGLSSTNVRPGGWVMLGGKPAAILGRISMNLTTVDVSGIDGVQVGDEVVLLGDGVTADDHARLAGTISYEILCGVRAG